MKGQVMTAAIVAVLLCLPIANCAKSRKRVVGAAKSSLIKDCVLPPDQSGTLSARWKVLPVPVALLAANFDPTEMAEINAAVNTWNTFYGDSLSLTVFDAGGDAMQESQVKKPTSLCSQGILQGGQYSGQVVIYKQPTWPYPNTEAIALTSFCPIKADPFPTIYMAIMEVNYQYFFVENTKQPDLQSIFLHEFGHLLGMDHSCAVQPKTGYPLCSSADLPEGYFKAVMYPVIPFTSDGRGEQRRELTPNDQGRANCLYQGYPANASPRPSSSSSASPAPSSSAGSSPLPSPSAS